MISRGDDYPLHQTSRPFRDPGTDRNAYDRFFFNGYPVAGDGVGSTFFAVAFGLYPGRNVMDAAFSVIVDGVQRNVRGSRLLGDDRLDLSVGPITVEIVEPLHQLRVVVAAPEANGGGVAADLLFTARGPAFEEPHYRWAPGHLTVMDITRMTQNGTWSGHITAGGRTITLTDETWQGGRDRSWGTRAVGERVAGAPDGPGPQFYWLWAPMNFRDECVLFDVNETGDGTRWHHSAMLSAGVGHRVRHGTADYGLQWRPGTRNANEATLEFRIPGENKRTYSLTRTLTFFMNGIGYGHPKWGHGMWVGPHERTSDEIDLATVNEADFANFHVQLLSRIRRNDGAEGWGILEMLIVGAHEPSGLSELADLHPGG